MSQITSIRCCPLLDSDFKASTHPAMMNHSAGYAFTECPGYYRPLEGC